MRAFWRMSGACTIKLLPVLREVAIGMMSSADSQKSQAYSISKSLAMAIARRESSFRSDAISSVGAAGLMQLMPGTARYVAKEKVSRNTLFQVDDNVEYGVQYLRYLMDKLNNNPVLVSASWLAQSVGMVTC